MPCDPQLQTFDDTELLATLSEVESLISSNSDCDIVWAADMNWDKSRDNHYTRTVAAAMERLKLTSVWDGQNIDYTHVHTDGIATSTIDHFLVSSRLVGLVEECGPVHRGDNLSRHLPIFLRLRLGELPKRPVPAWDQATCEELESYTA